MTCPSCGNAQLLVLSDRVACAKEVERFRGGVMRVFPLGGCGREFKAARPNGWGPLRLIALKPGGLPAGASKCPSWMQDWFNEIPGRANGAPPQ